MIIFTHEHDTLTCPSASFLPETSRFCMVQMSYHFHVFSTTLHHSIVYSLHFPPLCNHNTPKIGANQGFFKGFSNFQSNCSEIRHTNAKNKKHLQHPPSFHFLKKGMLQILFHICYAVLFNFMHKRDYFSPLCSTCACFRPCFTCQIIIHAMEITTSMAASAIDTGYPMPGSSN